MKNVILLLVMSCCFACSSGVKDKEQNKLQYLKKSAKITQAQGYKLDQYNGAGWIGNTNFVSGVKYDIKNLLKEEVSAIMANADQNFISLESAVVAMEGENYYIFMVDKWIKEDSLKIIAGKESYKPVKEAYIFSDYEHTKLRKTPDRYSVVAYRMVSDKDREEPFNKMSLNKALQEEIISEKDSSIHYLLTVKPEWRSEGKEMAQIRLPHPASDSYDYTFPYQHFTLTRKQYNNLLFIDQK